jgi:hypothetical protein
VYAYHLFHLARELEKTPLSLTLNFSAADWKRIVELITVSAMYQQFADGDKVGAYPDSITRFEQRNPAFLNPEDILVIVLALKGHDPDIKTARVKSAVISSAANIRNPRVDGDRLRFDLEWFQNESSHTLVKSRKPTSIRANGTELPGNAWHWDEKYGRTYLTVPHSTPRMGIEFRSSL